MLFESISTRVMFLFRHKTHGQSGTHISLNGLCLWLCVLLHMTKTPTAVGVRVGLLFLSWVTLDESIGLSQPGFTPHHSVTSSPGSDSTGVMRTRRYHSA